MTTSQMNAKKIFVDSEYHEKSIIWEVEFDDDYLVDYQRRNFYCSFIYKNSIYVVNFGGKIYNLSNRGKIRYKLFEEIVRKQT